jgi:hypothetical protein
MASMNQPRPVPPGHQTYPRSTVTPREQPVAPVRERPTWSRLVPALRSFPRR